MKEGGNITVYSSLKNASGSASLQLPWNAAFYRAKIGCVGKKDDNNNIAFVPVEKVASDQGETAACTLLHCYTSWEELTKGLCLQEPCSLTSG